MSLQPIGGDFHAGVSEPFFNGQNITEVFFPGQLANLKKGITETATDSFAKILFEAAGGNTSINLWFPAHYCFETITRLIKKVENQIKIQAHYYFNDAEPVKMPDSINVVLVNHFNGFDEAASASVKKYTAASWIVVEDFVHAPLDIYKTKAEYSFNSLRKLTDIEVSVYYSPKAEIVIRETLGAYLAVKKEAAVLKSEFLKTANPAAETKYLELFKTAEALLNRAEINGANEEEVKRFNKTNWQLLKQKRVENYNSLLSNLNLQNKISVEKGSYMYFIINTEKRDALKKYMFNNYIFPVIHWPDSKSELSKYILSFHIDQRYQTTDIIRTTTVLNNFFLNA